MVEGMAVRGALGPLSGLICEIVNSVDHGNLSQIWTFVTKKSGKNHGISETSGCDNHDNQQWVVDLFFSRKRQREQEIAEEEAAKKKKEWEKEWEVRFFFK